MKKSIFISIFAAAFLFTAAFLSASGAAETETIPNEIQLDETAPAAEKPVEQPKKQKVSKSKTYLNSFNKAVEARDYLKALEIWQDVKNYREEEDSENVDETFAFIENTINEYFEDVSFEKVSAPAATTKGKAFKSAFAVKLVSKEGKVNPQNLKYTVSYPVLDADGNKSTEILTLEPKEDGTIEFTSPALAAAISSYAVFKVELPAEVYSSFEKAPSIKLPYLVATNMKASGGSIGVVDFTKAGKPITSNSETSSAILTELIKKGFTRIGNCDFVNEVVSKNDAAVQRAAADLFGKSVTYLIYGTVKYETVEKVENGTHVVLKAELKVRNILQNKELFATTIISEATDKSEWAATNAARKKLALTASDQILYGM